VSGGGSTEATASGGATVAVEMEKKKNTPTTVLYLLQGDESDLKTTCGSSRTH
jgi:hypothetical protein